ncbi:MAG: DNA-protecting protein DprA [Bdellovibrionales bacterium]|nr:DNA-protecting protein DprA [Bdellovibrionales bacterium]
MQDHTYSVDALPIFKTITDHKAKTLRVRSPDDPAKLFERLPENGLAIVGTRYPQRRSFELLESVLRDLQGTGLIIISGFARGIDSRAHELAIENGLRTIAVLGCGLDVDYPRENRALRRKILESGGMMVSHFENHTPAFERNFLDRNRLIAGFAKATWVVEAAEVSGTLNTAKHAMELNRDLYATSCFPSDHFFKGNQKLLSKKDTNRYPIADPLFDVQSLATSWKFLSGNPELGLSASKTALSKAQTWVLELKNEFGACHLQTLMNLATGKGMSLSAFYAELELEFETGNLTQDSAGRIEIAKSRRAPDKNQ